MYSIALLGVVVAIVEYYLKLDTCSPVKAGLALFDSILYSFSTMLGGGDGMTFDSNRVGQVLHFWSSPPSDCLAIEGAKVGYSFHGNDPECNIYCETFPTLVEIT